MFTTDLVNLYNRNIFKTSLYIYIFQDEKCRLLRNLSLSISCTYLSFYSLKNKHFKHWKFSFVFRRFLNLKKGSDNDGGFREKKIFDNLTLICFAEKCKISKFPEKPDFSFLQYFTFFYEQNAKNFEIFGKKMFAKNAKFSRNDILISLETIHKTSLDSFITSPPFPS